ncbi:hypothetical protein ACS0TY_022939 [Phlomoides rotata]
MITLSWNCRGLGNQATVRTLKKLLHENDLSIIFLMETKLSYTQMNALNSRSLHSEGCLPVECEGSHTNKSGGLCMLWRNPNNVSLIDYSRNHISLKVRSAGNGRKWLITGMYRWPNRNHRQQTFQLLHRIALPTHTPWLCLGDFNEIFWSWEKRRGNSHRTRSMEAFWETASTLGLQDLGFSGYNFTWSNGRVGDANIQVRLDRALANSDWRSLFLGARVIHLPRFNSDHSHIIVRCDQDGGRAGRCSRVRRPFRFEKMWLEHKHCTSVVELGWEKDNPLLSLADRTKNCGERLKRWDQVSFGNIGRSIKITRDRIDMLKRIHRPRRQFAKLRFVSVSLMSCSSRRKYSGSNDPGLCGLKMETETHPSSIRRPPAEKEEIPFLDLGIREVSGSRETRE